jgi:hypothetical protein
LGEFEVEFVHTIVGGSFAAPWHSWIVVLELVTPPLRLFVTV